MQDQVAAGNLAVKRRDGVDAMIPIDIEAKEPKLKLGRLSNIEDAQNGDDRIKADLHNCLPRGTICEKIETFIGQATRPLPRVIRSSACSLANIDLSSGYK